jgi:hypothetical protein
MLQWRMWSNHGRGLLAGEFASPWHCLLLSGGMPSTGLRLLPLMTIVVSLNREVGFWPQCCHTWGNHHHGRSILHPWCGCGGSEWGPRVAPSRGRAQRHEELLSEVLNHGSSWDRCPTVSWAHESCASWPLLGICFALLSSSCGWRYSSWQRVQSLVTTINVLKCWMKNMGVRY